VYSNNECNIRISRKLYFSFDIRYIIDINVTSNALTFISRHDYRDIFDNRGISYIIKSDYPISTHNKYIINLDGDFNKDINFEIFY
jgi:hypothetical protein